MYKIFKNLDKYKLLFDCKLMLREPDGLLDLYNRADGKMYDLSELTVNDVNKLINESIETKRNLLLEKNKTKEIKENLYQDTDKIY